MDTPTPLLLLNAFVAGAVIIVVLYTLAIFVRCSIELHQLKVETHRLRIAYFERVAALRSGAPDPEEEIVGVDIVEPEPVEASAPAAPEVVVPERPETVQTAAA